MKKTVGLYIHIPFCEKKCSYCSFLSFKSNDILIEKYIDYLCKEIQMWGKSFSEEVHVDTIFIGGGTPSLIPSENIKKILSCCRNSFCVDKVAEISMESNPNSIDKRRLSKWLEAGVNRLSIGVQSTHDDILKRLGRIHTKEQAIKAFFDAREIGFKNINVDLMFGIGGQSYKIWHDTLEQVVDMNPDHISFYSLQIEEGTKFYDMYKNELLPYISNDKTDQMYYNALNLLSKKGYIPYEISNASLPGMECRHNLKYWNMEPYIGVGLGASGYIDNIRYTAPKSLEAYFKIISDINLSDKNMNHYISRIFMPESIEESASIYVFTGMRKRKGMSFKGFREKINRDFFDFYEDKIAFIEEQIKYGNIIIENDHIALTEKGITVSNDILCEFV